MTVIDTESPISDRILKKQRIAVIGAGIIGVCIAYTLRQCGANVVLIDRDEPGLGCSFGNAGAISISSVAPLAMPGVISSLPRMLVDSESPFFLPISHLPEALPWLIRFLASARPTKVAASSNALASLHSGAMEAHQALAKEVGVPELIIQRGQLHLYPDLRSLSKDAVAWQIRSSKGLQFSRLDRQGILELEPHISDRYQVGVYLPHDGTILNPLRYIQAIVRSFASSGGEVWRDDVRAMTSCSQNWKLNLTGSVEYFSDVVVAAGIGSSRLLDPIGLKFRLKSQRGYHAQFTDSSELVSRSVVLADRKVFLAPMEEGLRVSGTVELARIDRPPDMRRAKLLESFARQTFKGLKNSGATYWMGNRPCMPDSVPVIGRTSKPGLWVAIGHGHLGMTDSVGTAKRIADDIL